MLKTIRKYRRSVLGVVGIGLVALSMGGFGVNMAAKSARGNYAIKVGEKEISYDDYAQVRRGIDARYRKMLGNDYAKMLKSFNINVAQQAVDSAINNTLLDQFAQQMGFSGSSRAVQEMINTEIFGGQFNPQSYASFLASQGISAAQFEEGLRKDISRQQLVDLFTDASKATNREARAMLARDKTSYSFLTLKVEESEMKKTVAEPSADEIGKYYDDNLTDFQTPAQVSYNYIALDPSDFFSKVPFTQDDIELEYTDNPSGYQTKPEVRISQIIVNIPKNANDTQKATARKSIDDISKKLKDGEKFEDLAKSFSQDVATAIKAGDAGWFQKDALPKAVADKAFASKIAAVSDPIETENAFYIVRLEDKKEPVVRPLEEVKEDIIKKIQNRDAASVLVLHAQELYDNWTKSDKSLADFAKENSLKEAKPASKLSKELNPETTLKELTSNILASASSKKQLIEIGDKQVLAEVTEVIEEGVEPLDAAKARIVEILKNKAAKEQARAKANKILESIRSGEATGLLDAAAKNSLKTEEFLELTVSSAKGVVAEPNIRDRVFSFSSAPQKPNEVFEQGNDFVLVELTSIKQPSEDELKSGIDNMQQGLSRDLSDFSLNTFISKLKSETKIDVRPGLLAE